VRFVTVIDEGNIALCRKLMKGGAEVFHNDRVKGNFQIADGIDYLCYIIEKKAIEKEELNSFILKINLL
jgi:hypothetical protein